MTLIIAKTWSADDDFLADDINANFTNIKNKFSETANVGIGDGDCASNMDLNGNKLSTTPGKQIKEDRIEKDAVTALQLRSSLAADGNRAVTTDHVRNQAITKGKVKLADLTKAQIALSVQTPSFGATVAVAGEFVSATPVIVNNAGNYRIEVRMVWIVLAVGILSTAEQIINLDPAVAIPVATNTIVDVHFTVLAGLGTGSISGTVAITAIPNS